MTPWNIHPAARQEHDDIIIAYSGVDESLVIAFEECYLRHRHLICTNPLLFNIREGAVRRANLHPRFGEYYIAYMIWRRNVVILAVAHAKRRPLYWRRRIDEARELFK